MGPRDRRGGVSCALGQVTCRPGLSVRYERVPRLLESLRLARGNGSPGKRMLAYAKTDLLILDDFGLGPLGTAEEHDLLEVIEDRHGLRSTIIASQLPFRMWYKHLGEPPVADAILDRVLSNSRQIEVAGESLRRSAPEPNDQTAALDNGSEAEDI